MLDYPKLDLRIVRQIKVSQLRWPTAAEVGDEAAPGCNRQYADLRRLSWSEARRVLDLEGELMSRMEHAVDPESEYEVIDDELCEGDCDLLGLDIGVASSVVALSAARCVPFTSCNGGVFGGGHLEAYPLVVFFCRPPTADVMLSIATHADVGLENHDDGSVMLYSDDVRKLRRFAGGLVQRRSMINAVRLGIRKRRAARRAPESDRTPSVTDRVT